MGDPDDVNDPETGDLAMFRCYHEGKFYAHAQSWVPDGGSGCVTCGCIVSNSKCIFVSLAGIILVSCVGYFKYRLKIPVYESLRRNLQFFYIIFLINYFLLHVCIYTS